MKAETIKVIELAKAMGIWEEIVIAAQGEKAEQQFYTAKEIADRYKISMQTLQNWRAIGIITASFSVANGGTVRFTESDISKFEKRNGGRKGEEEGN